MRHFYVGDGVYGFRRWVFARVLYRLHPEPATLRVDPGLPDGYSWCTRVDGRGLYARKHR